MKIAHSTGMGEAFGAVLLGTNALAGVYATLLPSFGNSRAALSASLGTVKSGDGNCG